MQSAGRACGRPCAGGSFCSIKSPSDSGNSWRKFSSQFVCHLPRAEPRMHFLPRHGEGGTHARKHEKKRCQACIASLVATRILIWQHGSRKTLPSFALASWGGKLVPKKSAGGKEGSVFSTLVLVHWCQIRGLVNYLLPFVRIPS